jgi:glycine/D-amino acid oxidase-like deaminating enzyme
VCVLERDELCAGASGRNAGFLMRGAADHYAAAVTEYGREKARLLWRLTEDNLTGLRAEGASQLTSFRSCPSVLLALNTHERDELITSLQLLKEDGFAASWLERGTDSAWKAGRVLAGLVNPGDASCNPVSLVRMLASKLERPVLERREVLSIHSTQNHSSHASGVCVQTSGGVVQAHYALICTNAYGPLLFPDLERYVTPRRGQMIAITRSDLLLNASYYANHGSEYFRQAEDGTVVVGGCRTYFAADEVGYEDKLTDPVQNAIEAFAVELFGVGFTITARWSGTMGFSFDGLPLVGPLRAAGVSRSHGGGEFDDAVWFCGAFTGHGMSMAYRTAEIAVAAMIDGAENPFSISRCVSSGFDARSGEASASAHLPGVSSTPRASRFESAR